MFSVREKSLKMLVSGNINSDSKILINRNIATRVHEIMPYLDYDEDPYMITVDGHLYWIVDAYTATNRYPYSEPYSEETDVDYVRNSIKVVIDTYTGETNYYIVDPTDPIAQTFQNIYPKLFKDFKEMPEGIRAHIRYPGTLLNIQADRPEYRDLQGILTVEFIRINIQQRKPLRYSYRRLTALCRTCISGSYELQYS